MASLFYNWRCYIIYKKKKRVNKKVKAFNCLKKNIQHRKYKDTMGVAA